MVWLEYCLKSNYFFRDFIRYFIELYFFCHDFRRETDQFLPLIKRLKLVAFVLISPSLLAQLFTEQNVRIVLLKMILFHLICIILEKGNKQYK